MTLVGRRASVQAAADVGSARTWALLPSPLYYHRVPLWPKDDFLQFAHDDWVEAFDDNTQLTIVSPALDRQHHRQGADQEFVAFGHHRDPSIGSKYPTWHGSDMLPRRGRWRARGGDPAGRSPGRAALADDRRDIGPAGRKPGR